jgi:transposase
MAKITEQLRADIIALIDQDKSDREIAGMKPVSRTTVRRIRAKYRPGAIHQKTGRKAALTARDRRFLVRAVTSGGLDTAVAANRLLRVEFGVVVSDEAVRRALRMEGLEAAPKEEKPKLSPQNVRKRH